MSQSRAEKRVRVNAVGDGVTAGQPTGEDIEYLHKDTASTRRESTGSDDGNDIDQIEPPRASAGTAGVSHQVAGLIKSIYLERFMSHNKIHIELGKHVNFITGANGTGKSAVLASLIVGLGGKVSATGKEKSTLFSLVQGGSTEATVIIEIHNQGDDAFEHEKYGDVIEVERKIKLRGSTIRLLAGGSKRDRREISRSKNDLTRMLDHFNIQVENPMTILNQEMSKAFVSSLDPGDKYKQFTKATQLDQIQRDYIQVGESLKQMAHSIKRQNNRIEVLKNAACTAEKRYEEAKKLEDLEAEIRSLEHQATWANINELMAAKEEQEAKIHNVAKEREALESSKDKYAERIAECNKEIDARRKQINEAENMTRTMQERHQDLKRVRRERTRIELERKSAEKAKRQYEREVESQRQNLQAMKSHASEKAEAQREERRRAIEDLENELEDAQKSEQDWQRKIERANADMDTIVARVQEVGNQKSDLEERRRELERELNKSEKGQTNRLELYGAEIVKLCAAIKNETRKNAWHGEEPIGPLGLYVEPIEDTWTTAIEASISMMIRAFAVTDGRDRRNLDALAARCRARITIINKPAEQRFSLSDRVEPTRAGDTRVEDVIRVANDLVYNILVDNTSIHQVLLCRRRDDARDVAIKHPQYFKKAFLENGDRFEPGGHFYATSYDRGSRLLQRDMSSALSTLKADVAAIRVECTKAKEQAQAIARDEQQLRNDLKTLHKKIDGETRLVRKLEGDLQHLRNEAEEEDADVNYAEMEEALSQTEVNLQESQALVQEVTKRELQKRQEEKPLQEAIATEEAQLKTFTAENDRLCDEIHDFDRTIQKAQKKVKQCQDKLDFGSAEVKLCKADIKILTENIAEETSAAQQLGFGEEPQLKSWNSAIYRNKIESLRKSLKEKEQTMGNINEIRVEYEKARSAYDAANATLLQDTQFEKEMREVAENRKAGFSEFRDAIALKSRWNFKELLSKKGYVGNMKFDHAAQTLNMHVNTDSKSTKQDTGRADDRIAGLSGGERSFTTSCFIVSLWEAIECPFRCLDEFDVFMDEVNRTIVMKMMVDTAVMAKGHQYVFLSPLGVKAANLTEHAAFVKVLKMPDKGQQTISAFTTN